MRRRDRSIAFGALCLLALLGLARTSALEAAQNPPPDAAPPAAPAPTPTPSPTPPASTTEAPVPGAAPAREGQKRVVSQGPGGKTLQIAAGPGSILWKDELILKEYVDIKFGDSRLQADFVRYTPSTQEAYAEGNVILDKGPSRLSAESLVYNLDTETGTFFQARGYADPNIYFEAKRVEKISDNELVLHDATFTACTQPIPYWSFRVGRGLLRLDNYAYLHNLTFKIGRVPVFYTPYLIWPIKSDRATGLLFPEFGFSRRGGTVISNAFYWPIRRNMDATVFLDYLSLAGWGHGLEYRYVPSPNGYGLFTGYYIHDEIEARGPRPNVPIDRWAINYAHHQDFDSGWRLVANANFISDFNYYLDYVRDLRQSSNSQAVSNLFLTRNWGFYSVNVRGERREQLVNVLVPPAINELIRTQEETITRWIQPEIELRGRRQRLGNLPLFLTLEASADSFRKSDAGAIYQRFDLFPTFSSQLSPVPWLDVSASAGFRDTYYTKSQRSDLGCDNLPNTGDFGEGDGITNTETGNVNGVFTPANDVGCDGQNIPGQSGAQNGRLDGEKTVISDSGFNRELFTGGLTLIGPKLSRVFDRPGSTFSPQYKHTIEPTIRYSYSSEVERVDQVIRFDEIDAIAGHTNFLSYALVTRLFAKRSAGALQEYAGAGAGVKYVGTGMDPLRQLMEAARRDAPAKEAAEESDESRSPGGAPSRKKLSTVEIATLEIGQDYSFLGPLSQSFVLGTSRQASPIHASLRINPSIHASVDVRTSYDVIFKDFREASLSANLRSPKRGFLDLTWSLQRDLESEALVAQGLSQSSFTRDQIGLQGETNLLGRRLLIGMQANYELGDIASGEPRLRDQRYKLGYNTQCCGLQIEILNRNFSGISQNEVRLLINLKGVGNVIDLQSQIGGVAP